MADTASALLAAFIGSDAAPDGKWWIDVPVGLALGPAEEHATADAVCLLDRPREPPEVFPDHTGTKFVAPGADEDVGVTKADRFRTLRGKDIFRAETVALVAVEPGASSVGTVGDLLAQRELVTADWDWTVAELILVSDEDSEHVNHVARELGVRAVRVA